MMPEPNVHYEGNGPTALPTPLKHTHGTVENLMDGDTKIKPLELVRKMREEKA